MTTKPLFSVSNAPAGRTVKITFEGQELRVAEGISVAAALLTQGARDFRSSIVGNVSRDPYCMMGVCFECLVEIDGVPARQSCMVPVRDGMHIRRQLGAVALDLGEMGGCHE